MQLANKKTIELRKAFAEYSACFWKKELERQCIHLELYLNDNYVSKFGLQDALDCFEKIRNYSSKVEYYEARAKREDPSAVLAEKLGIELA